MKTFQATLDGDTQLKVDTTAIDISTHNTDVELELTDETRVPLALAALGDPPPLSESYGTPEEIAKNDDLTDGELRYNAITALMALEIRRERLRAQTAEAKAREAERLKEEAARQRQLDLLESAYIKTLTKRRWSTAASKKVAETMYNMGARIEDPDAPTPESDKQAS